MGKIKIETLKSAEKALSLVISVQDLIKSHYRSYPEETRRNIQNLIDMVITLLWEIEILTENIRFDLSIDVKE